MDAAEQEYYRCRSEYITARQNFEAIDREWADENRKEVIEQPKAASKTTDSTEKKLKNLMASMTAEQVATLKAMMESQQETTASPEPEKRES
jgi:molecular chaperone DnaK (HSP70)